ncbi:hypothetical protein HK102_009842 [Quaeritorhiza haematococci]|nr:hypothetical protein HK102_009842 [Quaeritorhiza haematococci]
MSAAAQRRIQATLDHFSPRNELRFTVPLADKILTRDQRQFYEENGYLLVRRLIAEDDLESNVLHPFMFDEKAMMRDIKLARSPEGKKMKGEKIIAKVTDYSDDPVLFEYCQRPEVLDYVQCFTGPNIKAMHTMVINKPPNVGETGRHPLHQDLHYFNFRPADRIVCSWTAMEQVTRANGCLVVMPGTHKGELLRHGYPEWEGGVNAMFHGIKDVDGDLSRIYCEMEPGGANNTQGYRKAISCHYGASECHYIDTKGTLHEEIANEVKDMAKRRFNVDNMPYEMYWKMKGKLVRGEEGTL